LVQTSPAVLGFPSLQSVPSALFGFEQTPVVWSQVPTMWHWSRAAQGTTLQVGMHALFAQTNPV
jgi:hypothetical protein